MVRKTLLEETCCELVLFICLEENINLINDIFEKMDFFSEDRRKRKKQIEMSRIALQKKNLVTENLHRFGVEYSSGEYHSNSDIYKWRVWWGDWFYNLSRKQMIELSTSMDPQTGEMSAENILKFRPKGRWQDV